jgi:hypothetical protein
MQLFEKEGNMDNTFGVSPEVMERAKKMGDYFAIDIRKDRRKSIVEVRYVSTSPYPLIDVGAWAEELSNGLAWGHAAAFGMKGTITDVENQQTS